MKRYALVAALLGVPALAFAQPTDAVRLGSSDGAADQPRLVVTTSTSSPNNHATVSIQNALFRLSSTAALGNETGGELRYDSGTNRVRYYDGTAWKVFTPPART